MAAVEIIGAPQSNYVCTARMACIEKGVEHTVTPARPHTPEVQAIHPFGLIPVMRHGEVSLCETKAICTYVDLAFDGPPLVPRDALGAARCEQWVSLVNTSLQPVFARGYLMAYFFSGLPGGAPDRAKIEATLPRMREMLGLLDRELATRAFLAGDGLTLADLFLQPLIYYLRRMPESGEMLRDTPHLTAWHDRVSGRRSARDAEPPPMPKPAG